MRRSLQSKPFRCSHHGWWCDERRWSSAPPFSSLGVSEHQNHRRLRLMASTGGLVCRFLNALVWARPPPASVLVLEHSSAPCLWFSKPIRVVSLQIRWCRWGSVNGVGVCSQIATMCLRRRDARWIAFPDFVPGSAPDLLRSAGP